MHIFTTLDSWYSNVVGRARPGTREFQQPDPRLQKLVNRLEVLSFRLLNSGDEDGASVAAVAERVIRSLESGVGGEDRSR